MDDKFTFTLKSPITDEQWDKIMDVDLEHTDRIWFETKHGKVEFVKASAQPDRKTYSSMTDIEFDEWLYVHGVCTNKPIPRKIVKLLIEDAINETLSAQPEQRWIPVSEKLPGFGQRVLVSTANFVYEAIYFDEDAGWSTYNVSLKDVDESKILAWIPLPEPYKEKQDG